LFLSKVHFDLLLAPWLTTPSGERQSWGLLGLSLGMEQRLLGGEASALASGQLGSFLSPLPMLGYTFP